MLQQTQVATVVPYFERWMARFPTVQDLAEADEQDALAAWQGLGYYRRCRMLHRGARVVAARGWPTCAAEWRDVPGVGRYTAGAIASITLGERAPVVDGNVERVVSRLTGDASNPSQLSRNAWAWAESNLSQENPGDWNQALMELGATICRPVSPSCHKCPIRSDCAAHSSGRQSELPAPKAKVKAVELCQVVWLPICGDQVGVSQIVGDWWRGLWEFPRRENAAQLGNWLGDPRLSRLGVVRHTVTKHRISLEAWSAHFAERHGSLRWCSWDEAASLPMPAPQRRVLDLALKAGCACGIL